MQVNNNYSPNFGMAMKIKPAAGEELKKKSLDYLARVRKYGEELKDHKYVDVELNESLTPIVRRRGCANTYYSHFTPLRVIEDGLEVETRWIGRETGGLKYGDKYNAYLKFANAQEAQEAYNSLAKANEQYSSLDSAVEFAKLQEKSSAYRAMVAEKEAQLQAKVDDEVAKLMQDFPAE